MRFLSDIELIIGSTRLFYFATNYIDYIILIVFNWQAGVMSISITIESSGIRGQNNSFVILIKQYQSSVEYHDTIVNKH